MGADDLETLATMTLSYIMEYGRVTERYIPLFFHDIDIIRPGSFGPHSLRVKTGRVHVCNQSLISEQQCCIVVDGRLLPW